MRGNEYDNNLLEDNIADLQYFMERQSSEIEFIDLQQANKFEQDEQFEVADLEGSARHGDRLDDDEGEVEPEQIAQVVGYYFLGLAHQYALIDVACYELHHDIHK